MALSDIQRASCDLPSSLITEKKTVDRVAMSDPEQKVWPGESGEAYPDVFTKIPPQPTEKKPGQLSEDQIIQFFDKGYVMVPSFFDQQELEACKQDMNNMVDALAQKLHRAGKIKNLHEELDFFHRLTKLEEEWPGASILLIKTGAMPESVCKLWSSPRLLNVAEQILGTSDISGHPVWNLRCKTPRCEATVVPWHQDAGYLEKNSYGVMQLTAWIPMLDTNEHNGGMQMLEGGHLSGKVARHTCCQGGTWYVMLDEDDVQQKLGVSIEKDAVTCDVPFGGMLLFSNIIPHRSLDNLSDDIRWSLDLRWTATSSPIGFYGLKGGLPMKSSKDPKMKIDWVNFNKVDRHREQEAQANKVLDEFDTTMMGPWMAKWQIVNHNRHTAAFLA